MTNATLSPAEIIRTYVDCIWNQGKVELVEQFLAPNCWRHDTDPAWTETDQPVRGFSLEDQMNRLADVVNQDIDIQIQELIESDEYVTMIWNLICTPNKELLSAVIEAGYTIDDNGSYKTKGVEVFHVVDQKIVEVWSARGPWMPNHWGETQTHDAGVVSEQPRPLTNIVRDYVTRLWNQRDTTAIAEYLGETCWRHDAGEPDRQFMQFDQAFQHQRAEEGYATGTFDFQFVQMLEGDDFVTMIWDLNYTPSSDDLTNRLREAGSQIDENGDVVAKGIEVFCIKEGKIVEVWVAQGHAFKGHWGPNKT